MASEADSGGLSADFFTDILEQNKDAVKATVRDALLEGVKRQFQWELPEAVKKAVKEFLADEIIPAVKLELEANKDALVQAATEIVKGAPAEIGKAMQAHLAASLTNSYKLRQVTQVLFS
jgi:hypothetical protein